MINNEPYFPFMNFNELKNMPDIEKVKNLIRTKSFLKNWTPQKLISTQLPYFNIGQSLILKIICIFVVNFSIYHGRIRNRWIYQPIYILLDNCIDICNYHIWRYCCHIIRKPQSRKISCMGYDTTTSSCPWIGNLHFLRKKSFFVLQFVLISIFY